MPFKCQRDEAGWRVPRQGTLSRQIYDLAKARNTQTEIASICEADYQKVGVMLGHIRHPEVINRRMRDWRGSRGAG